MYITFSDDAMADGGMVEFLDTLKGRTFTIHYTEGETVIGAIYKTGYSRLTIIPADRNDGTTISIPYHRIERMEYA